jgi:hypothetical protein
MSCVSVGRWRVVVAFVLWLVPAAVSAQSVTLAWDPSADATGYTVRWGTAVGSYPNTGDAGNNTTFVISGLTEGGTYWTVVQAYNSEGVSGYSTPLQFTVPITTVPCSYSISPSSASVADTASTGTINVNTAPGCAWSATSSSGFLTFPDGAGRSGPGSVTFAVAANTATTTRIGTANIAGQAFGVSQAAAPQVCTYSISPASSSVADTASTGVVNVTTQTGCAWSATSTSGFLSFQNGSGRTGSGSVTFSVAANTATTPRTGTASIAGQAFSVSQAAAPPVCTYSISPTSSSVANTASTGVVNVTTQTGCAWSATSTSGFLTFQNGTGRTGSGSVTFSVAANTATTPRTGTASIGGQAFSVSQAAAPPACSYSINPGAATVGYGVATGLIDVTTQAGCAWSATSTSSFLTFQNGSGRTGSGSVTYSIAANTTTSSRIGTATVAGATFSVSQAAAPPACTYSISPGSANIAADASTGTITVTTQADCTWTASTSSNFLTFDNATGRTGSGAVSYAVTANAGTTVRSASATIGNQTFTLSQAAPSQNCTYTISPLSTTVPGAAGGGTFAVTTQAGCAWSASSLNSFLTFPNGTGRTGSGSLDFAVTENTTGATRTGKATVAGKTLTVYQSVPACTFTVDPERTTIPAAAGTVTLNVTTQAGCAWTGKSLSSYITIANGTGRTGSGTVDLTVAANTGTTTRTGISAVASKTIYVTQEAPGAGEPPPTQPPASTTPWSSDFDGDGKNDLLLQDSATGAVEAWLLDNATLKGKQALSDTMDANWALVGRGDFNADGKPDLVWQHKTLGTVYLWYMNGTSRIGATSLSISAPVDPQWKIVGIGDFNKDGKPDLAWQNAGDGTIAISLMNGATVTETTNIVPSGTADLLWKVVGVADFNGDGNTDFLWRHMGTGDLTTWLMSGMSRTIGAPLNPLSVRDQNWQVGSVMDANGDGKPDIIWEHTDGTIMIWHMNGTSRTTYPIIPATVPLGWHVVGPK